ncbi:MAG: Lrp/AsnC family transcriptional regulator [Candidatus Bathyarchaeota archaeon]|nr:Lrp/AsnC family transcriptional regulator [Candidatus Bathyarchaeota archaeon]MCX8177124.1 Lrp/AsnC family transcriptional regulator [Candidatus Bathyarchaeota archaeon]MDW8193706.1 Lrp/AsnC family transcriptional regulator [Nitrososphaerota archaeon]
MKIKNNSVVLDPVDVKILEALIEDSRQTYVTIGKRLGVAHSTVYDRIRKLESHGVIKRYTAIIDEEKAGVKSVMALMTVYTDPKESESIVEKLCKAPQVLEVYTCLSEELQIIAKVMAENQEKLHDFIAKSIAPLKGVLRIRTSIIIRKCKQAYSTLLNNFKEPDNSGDG